MNAPDDWRKARGENPFSSESNDLAFTLLATIALTSVAIMAGTYPFAKSSLLIEDDAIYLARALLGSPLETGWGLSLSLPLINWSVVLSDSSSGAKYLSAAMAVLLAGGIACLLQSFTKRWLQSALVGAVAVVYPITSVAGVFVMGSHPYFAGVPLSVALVTYWWAVLRARHSRFRLILQIVSYGLTLCAALMSPAAKLAVFAPALWVFLSARVRTNGRDRNLLAEMALALYPVVVAVPAGVFTYHYGAKTGWTNMSPSQTWSNVITAVRLIVSPILEASATGLGLVGGLLLVVIAFYAKRRSSFRSSGSSAHYSGGRPNWLDRVFREPRYVCAITSLVVAGLTFAPTLIVTSYQNRYLVLPFAFGCASAGLVLMRSRESQSGLGTIALAIVFLFAAMQLHSAVMNEHGDELEAHQSIKRLVTKESPKWDADAQVVVLLPDRYSPPPVGYNHWSTWYLRSLARRIDLIALVGHARWLSNDPFVQVYTDHGDEYWKEVGARLSRIRMKGITRDRPLYVYELSESGRWVAQVVAFASPTSILSVMPGHLPALKHGRVITESCAELEESPGVWWLTGGDAGGAPMAGGALQFFFDGSSEGELEVDLPMRTPLNVSISLDSASPPVAKDYSDSYPPMPLLTQSFAIYRLPSRYIIHDRESETEGHIPEGEDERKLWIRGNEGCAVVLGTGPDPILALTDPSLSGTWILGKGYMQRYWRGEIEIVGIPFP